MQRASDKNLPVIFYKKNSLKHRKLVQNDIEIEYRFDSIIEIVILEKSEKCDQCQTFVKPYFAPEATDDTIDFILKRITNILNEKPTGYNHWELDEQEYPLDSVLIFKTKIFGEFYEEIIAQHNETARTGVSESVRGAMALPQAQNLNVGPTNFEATFFKRCEVCQVDCLSKKSFNSHLVGKQHLRKSQNLYRPEFKFYCKTCDVNARCQITFEQHLSGKKHEKNNTT